MMRAWLLAPIAGLIATIAGCSGAPPGASYFPLEAGHRWVYDSMSVWENDTREREQVVLVTSQLAIFANLRFAHTNYVTGQTIALQHLFIKVRIN